HAQHFATLLGNTPGLSIPMPPAGIHSSFYRLYTTIDIGMLAADWNQDRIVGEINAAGVPCMHGSCSEIGREQAFADKGWVVETLPAARRAGETSLALLVHPTLSQDDISEMAQVIDQVMRRAVGQ
ncbi:MAG: aminotransferase, partial [Mariprofundaceae bacterium]|nr:aminotransferase [Mariprofundaceae bacterium]